LAAILIVRVGHGGLIFSAEHPEHCRRADVGSEDD
jgi:hypothetical protein